MFHLTGLDPSHALPAPPRWLGVTRGGQYNLHHDIGGAKNKMHAAVKRYKQEMNEEAWLFERDARNERWVLRLYLPPGTPNRDRGIMFKQVHPTEEFENDFERN